MVHLRRAGAGHPQGLLRGPPQALAVGVGGHGVVGVGGAAVSGEAGVDRCAPGGRVGAPLQDQYARPLGQHEAVPGRIEGPRGGRGGTGVPGERAHPRERGGAQRGDHGVGAAGDGEVTVVGAQQQGRRGHRGRARRTGRGGVQRRALGPQGDGQLPGGHVGQEGGQGQRRDRPGPGGQQLAELALVGVHPAGRRAQDDRDPGAVPRRRVQPGVGDGLTGGGQRELGEPVMAPRPPTRHLRAGIEAGHPAGEGDRKPGQRRVLGRGAPAGADARPGPCRTDTGRGDQPDAGDGDARIAAASDHCGAPESVAAPAADSCAATVCASLCSAISAAASSSSSATPQCS